MLRAFYDYLADMTLSFFDDVSLKRGDKYTLKLEDSGDVQSLYDSIKDKLHKDNKYVECSLPSDVEEFITASVLVNGIQLVIVPEIDVTNAYLTHLRNWINDCQDKAILLICHNPVDSISNGTESLQKEGMPFHKNRFCSSIEDRIKHSEMNNVEKQILYSALEKVEESGYLDSYSLHDFEEILEALYKGAVYEDDYPKFGLLKDHEFATTFGLSSESEILSRISANSKFFSQIDNSVKHGNIEDDLGREFTDSFADKVKKAAESHQGRWYEEITFVDADKSQKAKKKKGKPLEVNKITVSNGNNSLIEDEDFFVRNETARGNKKHILVFAPAKAGQFTVSIDFSDNFKTKPLVDADEATRNATQVTQNLRRITVNIANTENSLVKVVANKVTRNDNDDTDRFVFWIGIIGCAKSWFDPSFQTSFKIKANKTSGTKRSCLILNCSDVMTFNRNGDSKVTETVRDGFDISLDDENTQYELKFDNEYINDSNMFCGDISIMGNRIPIEFDSDVPKSVSITGVRIEQLKLKEHRSFQYVGDNKLQFGTNEYNTATDFKQNLATEKFIVDNGAACCEFINDTDIHSVPLDLPDRVSKAFDSLIEYYRTHTTLPSLAYYNDDLCALAQEYVDAVQEVFDSLKNEPLTNYARNVLKLGTVNYPAEEKIAFSPLYPLNVAFRLQLAKEDCSSEIREDVLKKITSDNLIPLIHKGDTGELYRVQEQSVSPQWTIYAPAKRKKYMGQRQFVSGLVRDKIERFKSHFKYLFDGVGGNEIIINAVNMGNCLELFKGIVEFFRGELKKVSQNRDTALTKVTINVYNDLQIYNAFEALANKSALKKMLDELGYKYDKEDYSESEFINLFMTNVNYYKLSIKDDKYKYSHLAFVEMDQESKEGFFTASDIRSGTMLNGMMSGVTSMYYGQTKQYRTGYGTLYNCEDNQLLELADVYNSAMYVFGTQNPYQSGVVSCTSVDEHETEMIEKTYDASNWVVFIDPRVDLNFFKNDQQDVMIIHYSDQHTSSSGYDSITVTRKTKQYENIIRDYLTENGYTAGTREDVRRMIDMFNAVNGDWLLKLISYKSNFSKEKISIQSAIKLALAFLKDDNITWIPISLEEILRVSGSVGYAQKEGLFSSKNLGFESAPTSDDLLMFGVEKADGKVLVHLYPLEVKIGYENDDELTKAKGQIKRTREIFDKNLLKLARPNFIQNKVYRNFIVQLAIVSAEKMNLYNVWESQDWEQIVNTDTRGKLLNDDFVVSSSLRETIGDGIVLSFKRGSIKREAGIDDGITVLRFLESDGREYVTKSVDDLYSKMLGMSDVCGSMLGDFSSAGFVEPVYMVEDADEVDGDDETADDDFADNIKSEETTTPVLVTVGAANDEPEEPEQPVDIQPEPEVSSAVEDIPVSEPEPQAEEVPAESAGEYIPSPDGMKILIGEDANNHTPIYWYPNDTDKVLHPNTGIIGTMGTGKTQFTKSIITQLVREQKNNPGGDQLGILIFDYKGDYNENKKDFVDATGAKVYKLYHLPFNPFSITVPVNFMPMLPLHTANAFVATIKKTYHIGTVQESALRNSIKEAYEHRGIYAGNPSTWNKTPPTLAEVYANYVSGDSFKEDSLSTALSTLTEFEIFEPESSAAMPLYEFINGVTVIDLSGYDPLIQNLVVAVTLDLFYSQMQVHGHSISDRKLRQMTKFILVDEADNFLKMGYPALRKILKEGREFGVGTILSTQFLKHFHTDEDDFSSYILNWIVHRVDDLSPKEVKTLFNTSSKGQEDTLYTEIKRLEKHYSIVKLGSSAPYYCKDRAFWELIKDES